MKAKTTQAKRVVIIEGYEPSVVKSRLALLKTIIDEGCEAHVIAPAGERTKKILEKNKIHFYPINNDRHSISFISNIRYFLNLYKKIKSINPDICLTYTIKPGIYGIIAAALAKTKKRYAVITGLGYSFTATGIKAAVVKIIVSCLYYFSFKLCEKVVFQNEDDLNYLCDLKLIKRENTLIVNGSGVDLNYFSPSPLPNKLTFLMVSRFLPEKGIFEYIEACRKIKIQHPEVRCCLIGYIDNPAANITETTIQVWQSYGIEYLGKQDDVRPALRECSVFVLPSYREGTPRSVIEAMATGRAIITTDAPGCRQTVADGKSGFLVPIKDSDALHQTMMKFISNPLLIESMGTKSLIIAKEKFDICMINKSMLKIMQLTLRIKTTHLNCVN